MCIGSGSSYLYGYLDQAWKEDMSKEEAEASLFAQLSPCMNYGLLQLNI